MNNNRKESERIMYNILDVAAYIVKVCPVYLTHQQLQNILYVFQVERMLDHYEKHHDLQNMLPFHEHPYAHKNGVMYPSVERVYRCRPNDKVKVESKPVTTGVFKHLDCVKERKNAEFSHADYQVLEYVIKTCINYPEEKLTAIIKSQKPYKDNFLKDSELLGKIRVDDYLIYYL